jgi:hypothetical protein
MSPCGIQYYAQVRSTTITNAKFNFEQSTNHWQIKWRSDCESRHIKMFSFHILTIHHFFCQHIHRSTLVLCQKSGKLAQIGSSESLLRWLMHISLYQLHYKLTMSYSSRLAKPRRSADHTAKYLLNDGLGPEHSSRH